ncbi:thymidylate synthase [Diplonema papillatum]|nr:thymidylate synthase [Diplonema papillatum]
MPRVPKKAALSVAAGRKAPAASPVAGLGPLLRVQERTQWRAWLSENHDSQKEVFLHLPKVATGTPAIPYADAVEEALCFGWIDSIVKHVPGEDREKAHCQRYTPRRKGSPYSQLNIERIRWLLHHGRIAQPELETELKELARRNAEETAAEDPRVVSALKKSKGAWKHWQTFPAVYRRVRIAHVANIRSANGDPDAFEKKALRRRRGTV